MLRRALVFIAVLAGIWGLWEAYKAFGEAVGLTWGHLDLGERPRIRVREQHYKGKRRKLKSDAGRRDVPLSAGMAARLLVHRRDTYGGEDRAVFASTTGTELIPSNVWRRVLEPTRASVGLEWVTFHTFRHTCASLLFEEGRDVKQVQEFLGHTDPGFTLRTYIHLMDSGVGGVDFLDAAVTADPPRSTRGQHDTRKQPQTDDPPHRAKIAG